MAGQIQQRVNLRDRHSLRTIRDFHDLVAGTYFAFLEHTEIESRPMMRNKQRRHLRLIHSDADAVTRHPRLCYFKQCASDPVLVTDAHFSVSETIDGEIFSKLSITREGSLELAFPVAVGIQLIHHHGALLAAVPPEIALPVTVDVQTAHDASIRDRRFPDSRVDRIPTPLYVPWKANVYRQQPGHTVTSHVN
jgi:hypothetical protein